MKIWIEPTPVDAPSDLRAAVGGHDLLAQTLARRGITDGERASAFLDPAQYHPAPPDDLPDVLKAVMRIAAAVEYGEPIAIWGDFDVDGQTATALLVSALRDLGANVRYHIPDRANDGHGVHLPALGRLIDAGARLIITCDTGIAAHEAADYAKAREVDFIITDHHNLPDTLPDAYAVVNPKRLPETHPLHTLPGVGCAYKVIEALYGERPTDHLLDLVALGIVADVALQTGDARYLLQRGLDVLRQRPRAAVRAILENARIDPESLNEQHIGFIIGPRLNALGRLGDANQAIEPLASDDIAAVRIWAGQLEGLNKERQFLSAQVYGGAEAQISADPTLLDHAALVLANPEWHAGVVGIVASRLVEQYNRPVILLRAPSGEPARGSARSVQGVDITAAIHACAHLLIGYGGHTMAAGVTLDPMRIDEFRRALSRAVRHQRAGADTTPQLSIDGVLPLNAITLDLLNQVERLAPFGAGNPPLALATHGLSIARKSTIGRKGEHLSLTVEDDAGRNQRIVWWNGANQPLPEGRFDLAYTIRAGVYRGEREVTVEWLDARPAAEGGDEITIRRALLEVDDRRAAADPLAELADFRREAGASVSVWCEWDTRLGVDISLRRDKLTAADTLIVWTAPPQPTVWAEAMQKVNPERVIIFAQRPEGEGAKAFLERLSHLVNYAISKREGRAPLQELAAATAQREEAVRAGLEWLQASGQIRFTVDAEGTLTIQTTEHAPDAAAQRRIMKEIERHLRESAAYRDMWGRIDDLTYLLPGS